MIFSSSLASASLVQMKAVPPHIICVKNPAMLEPLTQQDRVDIAITPELVEHGIVGEAGSTIEEERVEFVSTLDVPLKDSNTSANCVPSQRRYMRRYSFTVLTLSFAKSTGLFSGMVSTG